MSLRPLALAVAALALSACAGPPSAPAPSGGPTATISNCGVDVPVGTAPPRAVVTLNQGATEAALTLGLADRMAGTAYRDGDLPQALAEAYSSVPVLATEYPSNEALLSAGPDLVYASYASAYTDTGVGGRAELSTHGIASYLSPFACPGAQDSRAEFDRVWQEIEEVGLLTGSSSAARSLVAQQKRDLGDLRRRAAGRGRSVFWFDSGDAAPYAGVTGSGPQLILDAVGAENVFADVDGGWAEVSWEKVLAADPDVIVLPEATWSTADDKIARLESDPVLRTLRAVREKRYVRVPFTATTPGVRLVDGARIVSDGLAVSSW